MDIGVKVLLFVLAKPTPSITVALIFACRNWILSLSINTIFNGVKKYEVVGVYTHKVVRRI